MSKLRVLSLMPPLGLVEAARVMEQSAAKYGVRDWQVREGRSAFVHVDAIGRHLFAIASGCPIDPESGLLHWGHIAARALVAAEEHDLGKLYYDVQLDPEAADCLVRRMYGDE